MTNIVFRFLAWQFSVAPRKIIEAWRNFLLFNFNYFSISFLLRTFFFPWRRYADSYGKIFEFKKNFQVFTFNTMSRIIAMIARAFFILLGVFSEILIFFIGAIALICWFLLPILLFVGFLIGLKLIFF
ncbi:MAG TPA: hypothetical protein ENL27_00760 [Candidatus Parcubacteria bacterium]|nr:hypothetical protein [Candidatus Parcubacteria bacterium]